MRRDSEPFPVYLGRCLYYSQVRLFSSYPYTSSKSIAKTLRRHAYSLDNSYLVPYASVDLGPKEARYGKELG